MRLTFALLIALASSDYLLAQPQRIERNVARYKATLSDAVSEAGWKNGELIQTQGFDSIGDGGGDRYRYRAAGWSALTATQQSQVGWYVRVGTSDKYLEAVDKSIVRLRKWGCGSGGDQSVRLQAAVDAARSKNIWVDGENLAITGHLLIETNAVDSAVQIRNVAISNADTSYAIKIDATQGVAGFNAYVRLENVRASCSGPSGVGLKLNKCHFLEGIDNCYFSGNLAGMEIIDSFVGQFTNCEFTGRYPVWGHKASPGQSYVGLHVYHSCVFTSSFINVVYDNEGYTFNDAYGCTFRNCTTQGPSSLKYYFRDTGQNGHPTVLENCYFETPMSVTLDASDIGLGTIDPANGQYIQTDNSKLKIIGLGANVGAYNNSRIEIEEGHARFYKDSTSSIAIENYNYWPSLDAGWNLDFPVRYLVKNSSAALNAAPSEYNPTAFDPTVTNLVNPEQAGVILAGTPTLSRILKRGRLTSTLTIAATSGDAVQLRGNAFDGNLQSPTNSKFVLVQMMVRVQSGNAKFALARDIGGYSGSMTATTEWRGFNLLFSPVSNNRQRLGFYAVEDGTFEIADFSVTAWDTELQVKQWIDRNVMAGSGTESRVYRGTGDTTARTTFDDTLTTTDRWLVEWKDTDDNRLYTWNGSAWISDAGGHAQISVEDNATATTVSSTQTDWSAKSQFTGFSANAAESSGATPDHTNDHITITDPGVWEVQAVLTLSGSVASDLWELAFFVDNGALKLTPKQGVNIISAGFTYSNQVTVSGIATFAANDTVELWVQRTNGTGTLTITNAVMTAKKVSD